MKRDAATDTPIDDAQALPASCKALHSAAPSMSSGMYMIDPDGPGGDAPLSVQCDMAVEGGGWTIVFFPSSTNQSAPTYTTSSARLLQDATQVLLAYRSASQVAYTGYATLDMPVEWRAQSPFEYPGNDLTTGVSVNGAALAQATVRYGKANFATQCADAWNTVSNHGRLCIQGTVAPFYAGFATATGDDSCSNSSQNYNAAACTTDMRFSIAVR